MVTKMAMSFPRIHVPATSLATISRAIRPHLQRSLYPRPAQPIIRFQHHVARQPQARYAQTPLLLSAQRRCNSSAPALTPASSPTSEQQDAQTPKKDQPAYDMTFTCKVCTARSTHRISKQGYTRGTVLVQCPGCSNRHLIADHLKIFSDQSVTLEQILKEKGQFVKKGVLGGEEGNVEFWDDGTETPHAKEGSL